MKGGVLRRKFSTEDEIPVFEATTFAETHRTDVPAPITFDTFIELSHPVTQPFVLFHPLNLLQPFALGNPRSLLSYHPFGWIGFGALTGLRQLRSTGNPYRDNSIHMELIPLEEFDQPPLITSPHHDTETKLGVLPCYPEKGFVEGITYISYNQGLQVIFILFREQIGRGLAVLQFEPNKTVNLPIVQ
jgi:hypothetical protein